jgi:hypothetical protein
VGRASAWGTASASNLGKAAWRLDSSTFQGLSINGEMSELNWEDTKSTRSHRNITDVSNE